MPCIIKNCKRKVIGRLSPDLDIHGIEYCLKHKTLVTGAYICLLNGNKKAFLELTGNK